MNTKKNALLFLLLLLLLIPPLWGNLSSRNTERRPLPAQPESYNPEQLQGEKFLEDYRAQMYPAALGEGWDSYTFQIADEVYAVPAPLFVYLDAGWIPNFDTSQVIGTHTFVDFGIGVEYAEQQMDLFYPTTSGLALANEKYPGLQLSITLLNESSLNSLPLVNCNVMRVSCDVSSLGEHALTLPGGRRLGDPLSAFTGQWGEPREEEEDHDSYYTAKRPPGQFGGGIPLNQYVDLRHAGGLVTGISISNPEESGWADLFGEPLNGPHALRVLESYIPPTELGDSLERNTYLLNGELYRFPTPVKELLADGWEFAKPAEAKEVIASRGRTYLSLLHGIGEEQAEVYVYIGNPSHGTITPDYGFITELSSVLSPKNVHLELPGGIAFGYNGKVGYAPSMADLNKALGMNPRAGAGAEGWYRPEYHAKTNGVRYEIEYKDGAFRGFSIHTLQKTAYTYQDDALTAQDGEDLEESAKDQPLPAAE